MAERRDEAATYLRQQIQAGLHLGTLRPGAKLPSVRDVAAELEIDPRTALAAYQQLQDEGLVHLRPRSGVYVAHEKSQTHEELSRPAHWLLDMFVAARSRGMSPTDLASFTQRTLMESPAIAACFECNEDQITGLCHEVEEDYGLTTRRVDVDRLTMKSPPPAVREADLFITTRFHAPLVQKLGSRLNKPVITVTLRPAVIEEIRKLMSKTAIYFIARDPRFEDKLKTIFEAAPGEHTPRVVIIGRDDPATIPANAPTFIMKEAFDQLSPPITGAQLLRHVFCDESAAEILSFILRRTT